LDLAGQMATLESVRAELEAALGSDENWRALRRAGPGADRRDRDARLVKALEANPLYGAWTKVVDALRALREADRTAKAAEARDDLTSIRGISPGLARRLSDNGVTRYAKIAAWTAEDIAVATEILALSPGEIDRQNWIEQARLLTARKSEVLTEPLPQTQQPEVDKSEEIAESTEPELEADSANADLDANVGADSIAEAETDGNVDAGLDEHTDADTIVFVEGLVVAETGAEVTREAGTDDPELPQEIRERIRADVENVEAGDLPLGAVAPQLDLPVAAAAAASPTANGKLARKLAAIPHVEPIVAPIHAEFAERLQQLESDMDAFGNAIEAPSTIPVDTGAENGSAEVHAEDESEVTTVRMRVEPAEAKVTFVTRDPDPSRAQEPAPQPDKQSEAVATAFVPPGTLEEAQVTIVKSEPGAGPVRRFLKALSGD
jgi:predicted flap endonuclease-1-like 5' DNA nuclease